MVETLPDIQWDMIRPPHNQIFWFRWNSEKLHVFFPLKIKWNLMTRKWTQWRPWRSKIKLLTSSKKIVHVSNFFKWNQKHPLQLSFEIILIQGSTGIQNEKYFILKYFKIYPNFDQNCIISKAHPKRIFFSRFFFQKTSKNFRTISRSDPNDGRNPPRYPIRHD